LPLPHQDFLAESTEERLVMYADKFHSKSEPSVFNSFAHYEKHVSQFGPSQLQKFHALAEEFGVPNLAPLVEEYNSKLI
jgi:uncharacterized protein